MNQNNANRPSLDEYDDEAVRHPERYPSKLASVILKSLKWLLLSLAALVFALMIWRINAMENVPKSMKTLTVTEQTYAAYMAAEQRGEKLQLFTQGKIDPVTTTKEAYGYFWIADSVIIPDAQQVQVVVRYNNSTLTHLADDFLLQEIPSREEEVIVVRLRVIKDATPDDPTDNDDEDAWVDAEVLVPLDDVRRGEKDVYNYRRYVFDGVVLDKDVIGLALDFYYVGALDAEQPVASLFVYYVDAENQMVDLTKDDVTAIRNFGENNKAQSK